MRRERNIYKLRTKMNFTGELVLIRKSRIIRGTFLTDYLLHEGRVFATFE